MKPVKLLHFWHLCSLDAPTVAVVWTWFVSRVLDSPQPQTLYYSMFFGVWGLYVLDRILDAHIGNGVLRDRHFFHLKNRLRMASIFVGCVLISAALAISLPPKLLSSYLAIGFVLAFYLGVIHIGQNRIKLPKELVVGILFSLAVFLPSLKMSVEQLTFAFSFGVLCTLNGLFIRSWEGEGNFKPHTLAIALALACMLQAAMSDGIFRYIPVAIILSLIAFLMLHRWRNQIDCLALRACADLSLLTPFFFFAMLANLM